MKLLSGLMLTALSFQAMGQSMLGALQEHNSKLEVKTPTTTPTEAQAPTPVVKEKTSGQCTEENQSSLPLSYITALMLERDGKLSITHDPHSGKLSVTSPDMISNCSSMIEWVTEARTTEAGKQYVVEAKIKDSGDCNEEGCAYTVAKREGDDIKFAKDQRFKPTMKGFEACLASTGVFKDGKVQSAAIYPGGISEKFEGIKETGSVVFVAHGPNSKLVKPKYDTKYIEVDACDHYENIVPGGLTLKSFDDLERERILAEKEEIKDCGEYGKIADFIEKYGAYAEDLNKVRDELILKSLKEATAAIESGKYTDEHLKIIADFEKYLIEPKLDKVTELYEAALASEGAEKEALVSQMKQELQQLASYNSKPFLTQAIVQKLEDNGNFEDAARANNIRALVVSYSEVGKKSGNTVVTPASAKMKAFSLQQAYVAELEETKAKYLVRTGEVTGQAQAYSQLAQQMQRNIQVRTQNFQQEIASEIQRTQQPNGFCYRSPFRNVQRCIQDSYERAQELQNYLQHYNQLDQQAAQEYMALAQEYGKLEQEGVRYRQGQGETVAQAPANTTVPQPRANNETYQNPYSNGMNGMNNGMQGMMMNNQNQQYMMQQQYSNYNPFQQGNMQGQSGFQYNFNAGFNSGMNSNYNTGYNQYNQYNNGMNGMNGYSNGYQNPYGSSGMMSNPSFGQQQPYMNQGMQGQGYWQQPYQAYNQYNMYQR